MWRQDIDGLSNKYHDCSLLYHDINNLFLTETLWIKLAFKGHKSQIINFLNRTTFYKKKLLRDRKNVYQFIDMTWHCR